MDVPSRLSRMFVLGSQPVHDKYCKDKEMRMFEIAANAGLTPKLLGCKAEQDANGIKMVTMLTEAWDQDLSNPEDCQSWSSEDKQELTLALLRLPDMLQTLHSLGIVHRDLWGRNLVIRRNQSTTELPKFSVALIDFGLSQSYTYPCSGHENIDYDEYMEEERMFDRTCLRDLLCKFGHALDQEVLRCKSSEECVEHCKLMSEMGIKSKS